jgi:DNA-nicking Smr family endonuclease
VQIDAVLAFCQAGPTDGGAGALLLLLRARR